MDGKKKPKRILVSTSNSEFNNRLLKSLRMSRPYGKTSFRKHMSKTQVAKKIGVTAGQVGRYETDEGKNFRNLPKLKTLKKICLLFQIDPKDLLGLAWIDGELVVGNEIALDPKKEWIVPIKFCPKCKQLVYETMRERTQKRYEEKAKPIAEAKHKEKKRKKIARKKKKRKLHNGT